MSQWNIPSSFYKKLLRPFLGLLETRFVEWINFPVLPNNPLWLHETKFPSLSLLNWGKILCHNSLNQRTWQFPRAHWNKSFIVSHEKYRILFESTPVSIKFKFLSTVIIKKNSEGVCWNWFPLLENYRHNVDSFFTSSSERLNSTHTACSEAHNKIIPLQLS